MSPRGWVLVGLGLLVFACRSGPERPVAKDLDAELLELTEYPAAGFEETQFCATHVREAKDACGGVRTTTTEVARARPEVAFPELDPTSGMAIP